MSDDEHESVVGGLYATDSPGYDQTNQDADTIDRCLTALETQDDPPVVRARVGRSLRVALENAEVVDESTITRIMALLPGNHDATTYELIYALGYIGDAHAKQFLEEWEGPPGGMSGGKINTALFWSIEMIDRRIGMEIE